MNSNDNFMHNWNNALRKSPDGETLVVAQKVDGLKRSGFNAVAAADVLYADNYTPEVIDRAIAGAYNVGQTVASKKTSGFDVRKACVAPTCYDDVKPFVEQMLAENTAKDFMFKLARTSYPIVANLPDSKLSASIRIAAHVKDDNNLMPMLHEYLKPFFELTMLAAVEAASSNNNIRISSNGTRYVVASSQKAWNVALEQGSCDCEKYVGGNYKDFGLACEHIVAVAAAVSPHQKLIRGEVD